MSYDSDDDRAPHHDFHHSRTPASSQHRDRSPDYHYAGGSPAPYAAGAIPSPSQYEPGPHSPPYAPMPPPYLPPQRTLQPPPLDHRPRSMPPPGAGAGALTSRPRSTRRGTSSSSSSCSSEEHHRPRSPLSKAKHALSHTFSNSTSGLGVGVLGAIVGGLAAREVSERHHAHDHRAGSHSHHSDKDNKNVLLSTIVGAAVGGLGANAVEKRLERSRKKTEREQEAWERTWGREKDRDRDGLREVEEGRVREQSRRRGSAAEYHGGVGDSEWEDRRWDGKGRRF